MSVVKIFLDLETTGVDVRRHGIHQIAGLVEVGGVVVEEFNIKVQPNPKAEITPEALTICRVTKEDILSYQPMHDGYRAFVNILDRYVPKYDRTKKAYLVGYNNRSFDDRFLRAWFDQNGSTFFGAYFWSDTLDVLVLASQYLIDRREEMPSFKLHRVAATMGLEIFPDMLHDAYYDIHLTRAVYRIAVGLEIEL